MPRALAVALLCSTLLPGSAAADYPSAEKRAQLSMGMTEAKVTELLGKPDGFSGDTCKDTFTKDMRECRILHYRSDKHDLTIEMHFHAGEYLVGRWRDK